MRGDGDSGLPDGFERLFWKLVLLLNVGPTALAIAFYIAVLGGPSRVFWGSLAVGAVSLMFAARTYIVARSTLRGARG